MAANAKKTKITIKPFRQQRTMDASYADTTWDLLSNAIHEIHKKNASGLSFEELYRNAYNMVLHKFGDKLYNGLKDVVDQHLKKVADGVSKANDENFLSSVNTAWTDHTQSMLMIRDILMYMDRTYVNNNNVRTVYEVGLELFRDNIARNKKIGPRLQAILLDNIRRERTGEMVSRPLLKSVTQMYVDLGINTRQVYEEDFEKQFLEVSANFFKAESNNFVSTNSASEYLKKVERRLNEEVERVKHYLDQATDAKIKEVVERELITAHMKAIIEMPGSGLVSMLKDDKVDDLQRMYTLLGRVAHGHSTMRKVMGDHIKDEGKAIVEDQEMQERPLDYVQRLLDLKDKYDDILVHAMNNDKNFQHTLNQSFEFFINLNNRSPEYISLFIDDKLQKGGKGTNEEETEGILDKVMMLFRFIQEKDIFEKYYKQHLAKRLLLNRSSSDDQERNMIAKLKTECGYQFTSKLEGMFTDMRLSAQTSEGFKTYLEKNESHNPLKGIELNVHVLTTGFWPTQSTSKCNLPGDLTKCTEIFQKYYLSNHNGRRLTWQINMGSAEMRGFFGSGASVKKHELNVTTFQVCVLTLYNTQDTYTFRDLHSITQIPVPDLKRNLLALCANPTVRILKKEPAVKKFLETDTFTFNDEFKSKLFRVKLLPSTQKDSEPAREATIVKIDEDRKHMIEAAIVRVMKSRKSMQHAQLVAEVSKQLSSRFRPTPVDIKKRVESLIEREYLERSAADRKVYNYLA